MSEIDLKIIQLICELKTNKQISHELNISLPTLNLKIKNIYQHYAVDSRFKLIYKYKTEGNK